MSSSTLHYDRIEQIVHFFLLPKLNSSQLSLLISNLLYYERLTGLRLIDNGDSALTVLEEDVHILHTSSSTTPLFHSEQNLSDQTNYERRIGSLLDAQCPSALKILREDLGVLHTLSAGPVLKDQANGEPKFIDQNHQLYPLQKPIAQQAQARSWALSSVEFIDLSKASRAKIVEEKRTAANKDSVSTRSQTPATGKNRNPVTEYKKCLAYAPPLSGSTNQKSGSQKKRPVAADFFPLNGASTSVLTKSGKGTCNSGDITQLIEVEKAKVLKNGELVTAERNPSIGHVAVTKCGRTTVDDHLRDTVQPPYRDYPHGRKESNVIDLTASDESIGEQGSPHKSIGSPLGVSPRPQGNKIIISDAQDAAASLHSTPRSPHAEDRPAVKYHKGSVLQRKPESANG
ncbi:MAG: hypothetical protein L6R38_006559 [Xanthoria sp. 2 TBL-2021]|nr:MAG: hypothetical protein L6R38_006559 [Xanthoria sp. 2 TBL-2021]